MYLLDSDYLINFLNGEKKSIEFINKYRKGSFATSTICIAEILEGIFHQEKEDELQAFLRLLSKLQIFNVDAQIAGTYAIIHGDLRVKGNLLDKFDILIGATCISKELILVTGNIKHFNRIPKLKIYKPD